MHQAEIIVLLFATVAALAVIARKVALPYPIVLVISGLALSFIPRLPEVKLNPEIVSIFFCRRCSIRQRCLLPGAISGEICARFFCSRSDWCW
jgi:NhaP-type Na+/H+ or K+/H+ antiporter